MSNELAAVEPDEPLYRVARRPDPWAWPDWSYAGPDGTFGNRYDDPEASYRVLRIVATGRGLRRDIGTIPAGSRGARRA